MTLTIELTAELAGRLRDEATRRGVATEEYARDPLAYLLTPAAAAPPLALEEWERQAEELMEDCEDIEALVIPLEALRREHMVEDRGL